MLRGDGNRQKRTINNSGTKDKTKPMIRKFRGKKCMILKRLAIFRLNSTKDSKTAVTACAWTANSDLRKT
jgi:hypothetical protein